MSCDYLIDLRRASRGYDRVTCWTQARAGTIPPNAPGENPTVVLTMQKLLLSGSDVYYPIHSLRSTDLGATWTTPEEQGTFARRKHLGGELVVCDFWPKWHAASGTLLGTGHTGFYTDDHEPTPHDRQVPYATYDSAAHRWNDWHTLEMPDLDIFRNCGAGCAQRVDLPGGEILLPIYYKTGSVFKGTVTVLRCAFDGVTLTYRDHGSSLTVPAQRGLVEPSLAHYDGRFFLTLRNDECGYVAVSDDGLYFSEPRAWCFDDGEPLGNYNTQQHWVTHRSGLYLVYTRRGLNNDHVFRHRAPLVMARVDPERLTVLRHTERVVIPERGARLGNFGITEVTDDEIWVVEAEWMQNNGPWAETMREKIAAMGLPPTSPQERTVYNSRECEHFGSDNTVWTARLLWG